METIEIPRESLGRFLFFLPLTVGIHRISKNSALVKKLRQGEGLFYSELRSHNIPDLRQR